MSRVLLFTDDRRLAEETERSLRGHRHAVQRIGLAHFDALEARDFGADVILLDASGNGGAFAVRQRLLHDRALALVPLVALTESREEAHLLSAQAMMTKPIEPARLESLLSRLTGLA
jgi:DNA-binding response OmpR family regulator